MRHRVERRLDAALGEDAVARVAAQLERRHARHVRREGQHLQIEHQLDVLFPRVGHAERRRRQLALVAAGVVLLDLLDAPFDLADAVEIRVRAGRDRAGPRSCCRRPTSRVMPSRMLRLAFWRAARSAGEPPSPNRFSKAMRGSMVIGIGVVGDDQLIGPE